MPKVKIDDAKGLVQSTGSGVDIQSSQRHGVQARTATADGTGTAVITDSPRVVVITSTNSDHWVTLPAPVAGMRLTLAVTANGCEVRTTNPAAISINGVTAGNSELALAAHDVVEFICTSATSWVALVGETATAGA